MWKFKSQDQDQYVAYFDQVTFSWNSLRRYVNFSAEGAYLGPFTDGLTQEI